MSDNDDRLGGNDVDTSLRKLNLAKILGADPRPTFVIDILHSERVDTAAIAYSNPALSTRQDLLSVLDDALRTNASFRKWTSSIQSQDCYFRYGGTLWFGFALENRWKIISTTSTSRITQDDSLLQASFCGRVSNTTGDSHARHEATVDGLKRDIWLCDESRKRAVTDLKSCQEVVARLKQERKASRGLPSRLNLSRESSIESLRVGTAEKAEEHVDNTSQSQESSIEGFTENKVNNDSDSEVSLALDRFCRLAEAVDAGFFDFDTSGKLLYANNSWYALSGHPREPEYNTTLTFQKCVHPDDAELVARQWQRLLLGFPTTFEFRWRKAHSGVDDSDPTGAGQWVIAACIPVMDKNGQIKSIAGCITDINAQKQNDNVAKQQSETLKRARISEERFARFVEVAPIAIIRFDKHKNLEYCNDRWFDMTDTPRTQFENVTWPYGVADEDIDRCSKAWSQAIDDHSIGEIECRLCKDWHDSQGRRGQTYVHCTFFAEYLDDGTFDGLMWSLLDISHLKWAENMQKARADEALEAKRQQENFIDITSHEMRNPLSAMVQCADTAISSLGDMATLFDNWLHIGSPEDPASLTKHLETTLDAVQTILSCAAHQQGIVDDILTLSKLDANLLSITPIPTDVIEMVQAVLKMFKLDSSKAGVILTHELCQSFHDLGLRWLMLDPSRVSQILINLVSNALKFTKMEKHRLVTVMISASLEPPSRMQDGIKYIPAESVLDAYNDSIDCNDSALVYLKLVVQDTGRGLGSEEEQRLFVRFSQASPKTHVQYGGHGLGLFISRKLTEMQGGEIGFASELGVGSSFAFYIKTRRTEPITPSHFCTISHEKSGHSFAFTNAVKRENFNVLLVEDNLVNQRVLAKQLEKQGYTVFVAGHGVEALDFIKTTQIWAGRDMSSNAIALDIVLMDIEMPIMGGLECTRQIRQFEREEMITTHIPIISISANARQKQVHEAIQAGVDDTITKPFRLRDLVPKLDKVLGRT